MSAFYYTQTSDDEWSVIAPVVVDVSDRSFVLTLVSGVRLRNNDRIPIIDLLLAKMIYSRRICAWSKIDG